MEFQIRYPNSRYSVMDFMHYPKYVWVDLEDENDPKIRFETYDHVGKRIFAKEGTFTRYSVDGRAICVMDSFSDDYKQNLQISIVIQIFTKMASNCSSVNREPFGIAVKGFLQNRTRISALNASRKGIRIRRRFKSA